MISYFAPAYPGELFYSRMARTLAPYKWSRYIRNKTILAAENRKPGILLPAHVAGVLKSVPSVAELTEAEIVAGSLYYTVAPFVSKHRATSYRTLWQKSRLLEKPIVHGCAGGRNTGEVMLKYCPVCAQQDRANELPPYWRTVHQHPAVRVCPHHDVYLLEGVSVQIDASEIYVASDYANPEAPAERGRSIFDLRMAKNALWLIESGDRFQCSGEQITQALRLELDLRHGFNSEGRASQRFFSRMREEYNNDLKGLFDMKNLRIKYLENFRFSQVSAFLDFIGKPIDEFIREACRLSTATAITQAVDLASAIAALEAFRGDRPNCRDLDMKSALPDAYWLVKKQDPAWFTAERKIASRGLDVDHWGMQDAVIAALIPAARERLLNLDSSKFISRRGLLDDVGASRIPGCRAINHLIAQKNWAAQFVPNTLEALALNSDTPEMIVERRLVLARTNYEVLRIKRNFNSFKAFAGLRRYAGLSTKADALAFEGWKEIYGESSTGDLKVAS